MKASATIYNASWNNDTMQYDAPVTVGLTTEGTTNLSLHHLDQFIKWLKTVRKAHNDQILRRWEAMPQVPPFDSESP